MVIGGGGGGYPQTDLFERHFLNRMELTETIPWLS